MYLWYKLMLLFLTIVILGCLYTAVSDIFTSFAAILRRSLEALLLLHVHRAVNLHALATVGSLGARSYRLLSFMDSSRCLILLLHS